MALEGETWQFTMLNKYPHKRNIPKYLPKIVLLLALQRFPHDNATGGRSWRDKGEKMIDSRGKILDGWLSLWEIEMGESHHGRKPQGNATWVKIKTIRQTSNNHILSKIRNTSLIFSVSLSKMNQIKFSYSGDRRLTEDAVSVSVPLHCESLFLRCGRLWNCPAASTQNDRNHLDY